MQIGSLVGESLKEFSIQFLFEVFQISETGKETPLIALLQDKGVADAFAQGRTEELERHQENPNRYEVRGVHALVGEMYCFVLRGTESPVLTTVSSDETATREITERAKSKLTSKEWGIIVGANG